MTNSKRLLNHSMVRWILVFGVFILSILVIVYFCTSPDLSKLPSLDLSQADPDVSDAVQAAVKGVRAQSKEATAWGHLAMVLHAHGYTKEAHACYVEAQMLAPEVSKWPYLRAKCASVMGTDDVIESLELASRLEREFIPLPQLALGDALLQLNRLDEAEAIFNSSLRYGTQNARAYLGLGRIAMARGDCKACVEQVKQCLSSEKRLHEPYELLLTAYKVLRDNTNAAIVQSELAQLPKDRLAWADPYVEEVEQLETGAFAIGRRANKWFAEGKEDMALYILDQLVKRRPQSAKNWSSMGRMFVLCGRTSDAITALEKAIDLDPSLSIPNFYLGAAHAKEGRNEAAISAFDRAIELQPNFADAHYELARLYYSLDDFERAERHLRQCLRFNQNSSPAAILLGQLLATDGRNQEAIDLLTQAATIDPQNEIIDRLLKNVRSLSKP